MDNFNHNPYQENSDYFDGISDNHRVPGGVASQVDEPRDHNHMASSQKPVPPPRAHGAHSDTPQPFKRRPAPPPPIEDTTDPVIPEIGVVISPTSPTTPEIPSEQWDFPPLSSTPSLLTPSNFSRTRSLCFRRKKKNATDSEGFKASTVPRRKYMTDSDPDMRARHSQQFLQNQSGPNDMDDIFYDQTYDKDSLNRSPRFDAVPAIMDEENVADITEKIITNINDHLERFEKGQNGELERDNKHLNRDNAMLREKIRMLEEMLRENEAKADRKLSEEQAQNRKFILQVEKERRAEIQSLQYRLQHVEKANQDHETVNERLSSMVENLKKENNDMAKEITISRETNHSLQQDLNDAHDKLSRTVSRVDRGDVAQKLFISDINVSLVELEEILRDISTNENKSALHRSENNKNSDHMDSQIDDDIRMIDPKHHLLRLKELLTKLREEKRYLKNQKEELMHNIMDRRFNGITNSDFEAGFGSINGFGERSRSGSNNLENEISSFQDNHHNLHDGEKSESENLKLRMARTEKENNRLKTYIDKLLLIILETQPSLLEIKSSSASPERSLSPVQ